MPRHFSLRCKPAAVRSPRTRSQHCAHLRRLLQAAEELSQRLAGVATLATLVMPAFVLASFANKYRVGIVKDVRYGKVGDSGWDTKDRPAARAYLRDFGGLFLKPYKRSEFFAWLIHRFASLRSCRRCLPCSDSHVCAHAHMLRSLHQAQECFSSKRSSSYCCGAWPEFAHP